MKIGPRIGRQFVPKMWLRHPGIRGLAIDFFWEIVAFHGGAKDLPTNKRHAPGVRLKVMAPFHASYHQLPPDRKDHAYLRFRNRIGHGPREGRLWPKVRR